ncbi:MAG: radical SAM family RiPP maturation amino acid epimerase [Schwartzia sp.]|nr:radical SAM family RiPP maturation amino acid epimerase [Schwartzia sp. (in: firmicutes)]
MSDGEIRNVISPACDDAEYVREVAQAKRALELWTMEPDFQEAFLAAPEETLAAHGLSVDALSVKVLCDHETALAYKDKPPAAWPRAALRYRGFLREKIMSRERMAREDCVPKHPAFRAWRLRQRNRCWAELGKRNESLIHVPLAFELDLGCSVGCPFCGVMAGKLQKVCRYDETAALWKGVLTITREIIGDAAGQATCYYATEPLDNPDYEKFADDFFDVFGIAPQITTAAAMRKPERTKNYLAETLRTYRRVHRFSVLSLDILHRIFETFTPEELLCVELLPQFAEAPNNRFASAGRARKNKAVRVESQEDGNTISCISGFIVNMAEKSVRLVTPCGASEACPTGEILLAKETFSDAGDFRRLLVSLIDRYMMAEFPKDQPLWLRPGISLEKTAEGIAFFRAKTLRLKFLATDDLSPALYHDVLDKLRAGGKSAYDIAGELMEETGAFPAHVLFILKKFEQAGLLLEPYETPGPSSS